MFYPDTIIFNDRATQLLFVPYNMETIPSVDIPTIPVARMRAPLVW